MSEFSHHYAWLGDTLSALNQAERGSVDAVRKTLEEGSALCHRILEQNPTSELGRSTLERISAVLGCPTPAAAPKPGAPFAYPKDLPQSLPELFAFIRPRLQSANSEERRLDEQIAQFEDRYLGWGNDVLLPLIRKRAGSAGDPPGIADALSASFSLVRTNAANPMKNEQVGTRVAKEAGIPESLLLLSHPDPHQFAYGVFPDEWEHKGCCAGFSPLNRTMMFSKSIDFSNTLDMLVVMHETIHVPQQAKWRRAMGLRKFISFCAPLPVGKPRVIINDEYESYGLEIESADLLLDGALRRAATEKTPVDIHRVMERFEGRPNQENLAKMICMLSAAYFPAGNAARGVFPQPFKNGVCNVCIHDGHDVYECAGNHLRHINP